MSIGAYVGIGLAAFLVLTLGITCLVMYIFSKKCTFVCDHCGHTFKAKFTELLFSPHAMDRVALKCPKCSDVGAHKQ